MQVITRCQCRWPMVCGVCTSFTILALPFLIIAFLIWRTGR